MHKIGGIDLGQEAAKIMWIVIEQQRNRHLAQFASLRRAATSTRILFSS